MIIWFVGMAACPRGQIAACELLQKLLIITNHCVWTTSPPTSHHHQPVSGKFREWYHLWDYPIIFGNSVSDVIHGIFPVSNGCLGCCCFGVGKGLESAPKAMVPGGRTCKWRSSWWMNSSHTIGEQPSRTWWDPDFRRYMPQANVSEAKPQKQAMWYGGRPQREFRFIIIWQKFCGRNPQQDFP